MQGAYQFIMAASWLSFGTRPAWRRYHNISMAIIAVAGRKGGVGKSTIVGNLAAELSDMCRSVAVLDADPQHSLAAWAAQGDGMLSRCVEKVTGGYGESLRAKAHAAETTREVGFIDTPPG